MPKTGLSQKELFKKVLDTAESEIRKNGVDRLKITNIAKELNVSHAALYKYFSDKDEIIDVISEKWLKIIDDKLDIVSSSSKPPKDRIKEFFITLHLLKKEKVLNDPKMYTAFNMSALKTKPFVINHLQNMSKNLAKIVADGIKAGDFQKRDIPVIVNVLFQGTIAFHHPSLVLENIEEDRVPVLEEVLSTLLSGISINIK
jgi:AcrR family transcriptional regulator